MNEILECRFMRILLRGKKHDYDPNYLLAAYTDFRSVLLGVSDGDNTTRISSELLNPPTRFSTYEFIVRSLSMNEAVTHKPTHHSL